LAARRALALCSLMVLAAGITSRAGAQPAAAAAVARERLTLAGVPVGGKGPEEVRQVAEELAARLLGYPVQLQHPLYGQRVTVATVGAQVETRAAVEAVFAASPPPAQGFLERLREQFSPPEPLDIPLTVRLTADSVRRSLPRTSARLAVPAVDARLRREGSSLVPVPGRTGRALDAEALARATLAALNSTPFRAKLAASLDSAADRASWLSEQEPLVLPLPVRSIPPRVTEAHLKGINTTLSTFSTRLSGSANRVHNIRLACRPLDGFVLLPGEVFSYNEVVGPRSVAAGYREAPVIVRGELDTGIGGGICQVSSTLYNAVLLADLAIVRRAHHAFPVNYLPAGRDATVAYGTIDFRFRNSLSNPVAIEARVEGGRVVLRVLGHAADRRTVTIETSELTRVAAGRKTVSDAGLLKGRRVVERAGRNGVRVTVTRVVREGGAEVRREVIARDFYRPQEARVRIGTREAPATPAIAPTPAERPREESRAPAGNREGTAPLPIRSTGRRMESLARPAPP
jgi:vancomycin resistance protein YoaR